MIAVVVRSLPSSVLLVMIAALLCVTVAVYQAPMIDTVR